MNKESVLCADHHWVDVGTLVNPYSRKCARCRLVQTQNIPFSDGQDEDEMEDDSDESYRAEAVRQVPLFLRPASVKVVGFILHALAALVVVVIVANYWSSWVAKIKELF